MLVIFQKFKSNKQKKNFSAKEAHQINIFQSDLENLPVQDQKYDRIYSRFVFQHLLNPQKALIELYRVLKTGGEIILIDVDGILEYIDFDNQELKHMTNKLKAKSPVHLNIGRSLKRFMLNSGFKDVLYRTETMHFETKEKKMTEADQYQKRLTQAKPMLIDVFDSVQKADLFIKLFVAELTKETCLFYYQKFIVCGKK